MKIRNKFYLSTLLIQKQLDPNLTKEQQSEEEQDLFLLAWHLISCEEAVETFDEMLQCPVCFECVDNFGVLKHRDKKDLVN
jgi:hypothetical protein